MPRAARKASSTGIYHIMIRGIDRMNIFNDVTDKNKFLEIMGKVKADTGYELFAYCLMENHAHFLIKENEVPVSTIMKRLCGTYGAWFNYRHQRVGHLFQDRFKSECVVTDAYFITVLKYILHNPVKANIVKDLEGYKWSSYHEYTNKQMITDTSFFLKMLDINTVKAKQSFITEIITKDKNNVYLNIDKIRRTDTEAREIIKAEMEASEIDNIKQVSLEDRIMLIKTLKSKGISNRQIVEITGLARSKVNGI